VTEAGRVLIVDDDPGMCETLRDVIEGRGYEVTVAGRARAGLDHLATAPVDAAILDVMLPDMSGLEALEAIKTLSPATEVIFITGDASLPTAIRAINGAAFGYLIKPFEMDQLLSVLGKAVERRRLTGALRETNQTLEAVVEASPLAMWVVGSDGTVKMWNPAAERIFGWRRDEVLGHALPIVAADHAEESRQIRERGLRGEPVVGVEVQRQRKDGARVEISVSTAPMRDAGGAVLGVLAIAADITERKQLEEQLRQAQKLEALGGLAGGIAHDFNNLLTVIGGRSQIAALDLPPDSKVRHHLDLIAQTVERAAGLTRQLLAFSRKQVLEPRVLDLGETVTEMTPMLRRLIGEDLDLATTSEPGLWRVKADPSQIEQVIMNLVVNARDAMPDGGRLTIETRNSELDETYAKVHAGVEPGAYVMLAVTDTGHGMDAKILALIFQPFFTTKEPGKGTGLGLATVYGIVKQSGGHIWVYSEVGQGTSFKVYLPRVEEAATVVTTAPQRARRGTETILLTEDDDQVRALARETLELSGYTVLEAASPTDALRVALRHSGVLHLLLTDVVMPGMNGRALADRLLALRPDLKVLFMSGYPASAIGHHGVLDPGTAFLQKPFTPGSLARKVSEVLDAGA
jgi:two-component system cell cycle sensor histidine kinase/response regulator CckA